MATKLPGAEALGGLPSARSGRPIADINLQAEGRGIAAAGRGLQNAGEDMATAVAKARKEDDALDLARAEAKATESLTALERGFDNDPDYGTYDERYRDGSAKVLNEAGSLIRNPKVRELWSVRKSEEVTRSRDRVVTKGTALQREQKVVDYDTALQAHRDILADPNSNEEQRKIARANLENGIKMGAGVGLYSPSQAAEREEKWVKGSIYNRELMRAENDPDSVLRESSVAARIVGVESNGRADARPIDPETGKPLSSAYGAGQFTERTWLNTIAKHRPDLAAGKSKEEILALRGDGDLSFAMTEAHAKDNAAYLESQGIANPSDGAVYLAHFAGADGATKLLKADPGASAETILGAKAVMANKSVLKGKTAGEVVAWAHKKMGEANTYAELSPEQRFKIQETATRTKDLRDTEAKRQAKALMETRVNDLKNRMIDGKAGVADIEEARGDWLTDADDVKGLYTFLENVETDMNVNRVAVDKFADTGSVWDATDKDDKKRVDALFGKEGAISLAERDEAFVGETLLPIVQRTSMVPREAKGALVSMMRSQDVPTVQFALETMDRIERTNPEAFRRDMGEDAQKKLLTWRSQSAYRKPEEIVEELRKADDPATAKARETLKKDGEKLAAKIEDTDILDHFGADTAEIPLVAGAMRYDFDNLYAAEYARTGDADQARENAFTLLGNQWGKTDIGGSDRLMRYPPEKIYPRVGGSHDWIAKQAEAELRPIIGEGKAFVLVTDSRTESDIRRGGRPSYAVVTRDENGVFSSVRDENGRPARIDFDYRPAEDEELARADLERAFEMAGVPERERLRAEIRERAASGSPMSLSEAAQRRAQIREETRTAKRRAGAAVADFGKGEPIDNQEAAARTLQGMMQGGV